MSPWFRRLLPTLSILALVVFQPATARPQASGANASELRLDASLIEDFLRVIYFGDDGRYHFREYSPCSYQFVQNPAVSVEDGVVRVTAEYFGRRGSEGLGGCVGTPGVSTNVSVSARASAQGSALTIEILEVKTETMPRLTSTILQAAGVSVPMTHEFDLMGALNNVLYGNRRFGVSSLDVHDVLIEEGNVLIRLTLRLGIW